MGPQAQKSLVQQVAEEAARSGQLTSASLDSTDRITRVAPEVTRAGRALGAVTATTHTDGAGYSFTEEVVESAKASRFVLASATAPERRVAAAAVCAELSTTGSAVLVLCPSREVERIIGDGLEEHRRHQRAPGAPAPGRVAIMSGGGFKELLGEDPRFMAEFTAFVLCDVHLLRLREFVDAWPSVPVSARLVALGALDAMTKRSLVRISSRFANVTSTLAAVPRWSGVIHGCLFVPEDMKQHALVAALQRTPPPVVVGVNSRAEVDEVTTLCQNLDIPTGRDSVQVCTNNVARACNRARHVINYTLPKSAVATVLGDRLEWLDERERGSGVCFVTTFVNKADPPEAVDELCELLRLTDQHMPPFLVSRPARGAAP